jgi:hypothetical protein
MDKHGTVQAMDQDSQDVEHMGLACYFRLLLVA